MMINSIFVISALVFVTTIPPLLFGLVQNSDALKNRNHWKKVKISFFKSTPEARENSERFVAWLIVKTSQASFLSTIVFYTLGRI